MRVEKRLIGIAVLIASLALCGCGLDPTSNFDNGTLLKGKQAWETKRHADDWMEPIGDALAVLGFSVLEESIDSAIDKAFPPSRNDRALEDNAKLLCN